MGEGRFTVLASGSSGNCSLLEFGPAGILIDCGLPPQVIGERLQSVGRSWKSVTAVLLTHAHGDHWNRDTLEHLRRLNLPLIAHARHHETLASHACHAPLRRAGLTRPYAESAPVTLAEGLVATPVRVPHDADPTYGFRFDATAGGGCWSLAYASDIGHVGPATLDAFVEVDLLAIEFNHDVAMQRASGRHPILLRRVLGDSGHLSNEQAREAVAALVTRSTPGRLRHVVQLHLSRDCNTASLARASVEGESSDPAGGFALTTATQFGATTPITLTPRPRSGVTPTFPVPPPSQNQPSLPGMEDSERVGLTS